MPQITYIIKLTLDCRLEEDDPSDIVDRVLDAGTLQDAIVDYAADLGRQVVVAGCVLDDEATERLRANEGAA